MRSCMCKHLPSREDAAPRHSGSGQRKEKKSSVDVEGKGKDLREE